MAIVTERHEKRIKINWQFSLTAARKKLNSHYVVVNGENEAFSNAK